MLVVIEIVLQHLKLVVLIVVGYHQLESCFGYLLVALLVVVHLLLVMLVLQLIVLAVVEMLVVLHFGNLPLVLVQYLLELPFVFLLVVFLLYRHQMHQLVLLVLLIGFVVFVLVLQFHQ